MEEPCADDACRHPLALAYSLDDSPLQLARSRRRKDGRLFYSLIPTNLKGIRAATSIHTQLVQGSDRADYVYLATPSPNVCAAATGLPCFFTRRCFHTVFAEVLCAKIYALARLFIDSTTSWDQNSFFMC